MHVSLDILRRASQFVDSLAELDQPDRAPGYILPGLTDLIGCDIATYQEMRPEPDHLGNYTEYPAGSLDPDALEIFQAHMAEHPLVTHSLATTDGGPASISEVVGRQRFRRLGIYAEYFRHVPTDDQLAFTIPGTAQDQVVGIALSRAGRDFGQADSAVLRSVMPPMRNALRRSVRRHRAQAAVAADPDALADLTGRELQVLQMAARGRTNLAIARAIDISPRTVAKHLEHIYRKLGVTGRAAAVYRTAGPADARQVALARRAPLAPRGDPHNGCFAGHTAANDAFDRQPRRPGPAGPGGRVRAARPGRRGGLRHRHVQRNY
jgi:DNA-binding CsgD family transcriptional regulator